MGSNGTHNALSSDYLSRSWSRQHSDSNQNNIIIHDITGDVTEQKTYIECGDLFFQNSLIK